MARQALVAAEAGGPAPALVELSDRLGLSPFEQKILLLCAAMELDPAAPAAVRARSARRAQAMADLRPGPRALRRPELGGPVAAGAAAALAAGRDHPAARPAADRERAARRRADRQLHQGAELPRRPARAAARRPSPAPEAACPPSQRTTARPCWQGWARSAELSGPGGPAARPGRGRQAVRRRRRRGPAWAPGSTGCPSACFRRRPPIWRPLARLWSRESLLLPLVLYLDAHSEDGGRSGPRRRGASWPNSSGLFLLGTREAWPELMPAASAVDVARPTPAEQHAIWLTRPGPGALTDGRPSWPASSTSTPPRSGGSPARPPADDAGGAAAAVGCQRSDLPSPHGRAGPADRRPGHLGRPGAARAELACCTRSPTRSPPGRRSTTAWGFAERLSRGLGITALFAGDQRHRQDHGGRGDRPRAAARPLPHRPVAVVSKYIGETEKNLRRVFDAAEGRRRDAVLRRGRRAVRQAQPRSRTATTATPTSRSTTCCSGWRPTAGWRSWPPTCAQPSTRRSCGGCASSSRSRSRRRPSAARSGSGSSRRATPDRRAGPGPAGPAHRDRRQHPQHRAQRRLPRGPRRARR